MDQSAVYFCIYFCYRIALLLGPSFTCYHHIQSKWMKIEWQWVNITYEMSVSMFPSVFSLMKTLILAIIPYSCVRPVMKIYTPPHSLQLPSRRARMTSWAAWETTIMRGPCHDSTGGLFPCALFARLGWFAFPPCTLTLYCRFLYCMSVLSCV